MRMRALTTAAAGCSKHDVANEMPADGHQALPFTGQEFGTSTWQLMRMLHPPCKYVEGPRYLRCRIAENYFEFSIEDDYFGSR
jgi:hypothetical protein